jgi:hypothetical protein
LTAIKYEFNGKVLDIPNFSKWLYTQIEEKWERKQFAEINKTLSIIYPMWICILSIVIGLTGSLATVLIPVYIKR